MAHTFLMQFAWLLPSMLFGIYLGATTGAWHMLVMSGLTSVGWLVIKRVNDSRQPDLNAPVVINAESTWIGDYQLPKRDIFWKREWHDVVYRAWLAQSTPPKFEVPFEITDGHAIIVGPTGSGKSELLKLLVQHYLSVPSLQLLLVDYKGGATLARFANHYSGKVRAVITDIDGHDSLAIWRAVSQELERRELAFATQAVSRIEEYSRLANDLPRLLIVVDELAGLLVVGAAQQALAEVAARGRSLGVHLILASQSAQGIPRAMLVNLKARVLVGETDPIDMAQLGVKRPTELAATPPGWRAAISQNSNSLTSYFFFPVGAKMG